MAELSRDDSVKSTKQADQNRQEMAEMNRDYSEISGEPGIPIPNADLQMSEGFSSLQKGLCTRRRVLIFVVSMIAVAVIAVVFYIATRQSSSTPGILIAGGHGDASNSTEMFLPLSNKTCTLADDMPGDQQGGTMSTVDDRAVYCYGYSCQQFSITGDSGAWTHYANTSMSRYEHSSWVSQAGLYLLGGWYSGTGTTTEIVPGGMSFTLQHDTWKACSIPSDDSTSVILTGGWDTWTVVAKYDLQGFVELLPSLSEGRRSHACGTYHDGDQIVQVVAGGWDGSKYLASTEWLLAGVSQHWTTGHPLPRAMRGMAFSSTDNTMYILGGDDGDYRDEIYSHAGGSQGEWKEAGRLMTKRGYSAAALLIVNSDSCK